MYDPEEENLHDWLRYSGSVRADVVIVSNIGVGAKALCHIHRFVCKFNFRFVMNIHFFLFVHTFCIALVAINQSIKMNE